jgi:hypothetical protein
MVRYNGSAKSRVTRIEVKGWVDKSGRQEDRDGEEFERILSNAEPDPGEQSSNGMFRP